MSNAIRWTHRGEHVMSMEAITLQQDRDESIIRPNLGGWANSLRRTASQIADRRDGQTPGLPFEFVIYRPDAQGVWTAFYNRAALDKWLAAYGMTLDVEPEPGTSFRVMLPATDENWQPLRDPDADGVEIENGYVVVDTGEWVNRRTGGLAVDVNDAYKAFAARFAEIDRYTNPADDSIVELFITARVGNSDWRNDDFAVVGTADGGGLVNLSDDVRTLRYYDRDHGSIAFVLTDCNGGQRYADPVAYCDTVTEGGYWQTNELSITCSADGGHGWYLRAGELTTETGTFITLADAGFPDRLTTNNDDYDSDAYGDNSVICPTHRQPCGLTMTGC